MLGKSERISFRVTQETLDKLNALYDEDAKICEFTKIKSRSKSDVLQDLINNEYCRLMNKNQGPDFLSRIHLAVDEAVDSRITRLEHIINNTLPQQDEMMKEVLELKKQNKILILCMSVILRSSNVIFDPTEYTPGQIYDFLDKKAAWLRFIDNYLEDTNL